MSQSEKHRELILTVSASLQKRYVGIKLVNDLPKCPGEDIPPLIRGFRPDVYACDEDTVIIIAEAKTNIDIDNRHTRDQVSSFISHLENDNRQGTFVLAVAGTGADIAKTVLRFICKEMKIASTQIQIFDTCDYWNFDFVGGVKWHLI